MNRPIEFRGKRIDNGEWIYGYYRCIKWELDRKTHEIINGNSFFKVLPESVGQYTGLKDKNKKEICFQDLGKDKRGNIWRVDEMKNATGFGMTCITDDGAHEELYPQHLTYGWIVMHDFEVIGNSLEHSHLLEGRK